MKDVNRAFWVLFDEAASARAHFHTWWTLRNLALPEFYSTMNNHEFVDFFHVANSGNYKLVFFALSKFYDRDDRTIGISKFKGLLRRDGLGDLADRIDAALQPIESDVQKILNIRNKTIGHNEESISKQRVYEMNGISADDIREVIDVTCDIINDTAHVLDIPNLISEGDRTEQATLKMLSQLRNGET